MYDPYRAFQKSTGGGAALRITKQVAFADEATWLGEGRGKMAASSRWSASSTGSPHRVVQGGGGANVVRLLDVKKAILPPRAPEDGADVARLLDLKKARRAVPVRPVGDAGMELRSGGNCI